MNISEAKLLLGAAELANDSVIFEGKHGVGKSDIIKQYSRENNYFCQELFLSLFDTGDLAGIPRSVLIGTTPTTVWAAPDWFVSITDAAFPQVNRISDLVMPTDFAEHLSASHHHAEISRHELNDIYARFYSLNSDELVLVARDSLIYNRTGRRSVLFLDELNRSNLDVRQAALQLILNKELHCHKLPYIQGKCTIIVAAINPSDAYQVDELDAALLDRFLHAELKADAKEWLGWARSNNVNQVVQDFIAEHPDRLHWTPKDNGIGSTPRSWAKLAAYMDNIQSVPQEIHFPIMKGKIGSELAGQFLTFFNNYSKVVKLEDIEALVAKQLKRSQNPEVIAKAIAKVIDKQEAIQKTQLAENLYAKYIVPDTTDAVAAMPAIAFLYAVDIEVLASFLKQQRGSDHDAYMRLATFDNTLNKKALFTKLTTKIQS